jgi:hypothetical protein
VTKKTQLFMAIEGIFNAQKNLAGPQGNQPKRRTLMRLQSKPSTGSAQATADSRIEFFLSSPPLLRAI